MHKKIIIGAIILFTCFIIFSYYNNSERTEKNVPIWRTEISPIIERFPNIGNIERCYWKADTIGENSRFSIPAPSSYWMKGFIILNNNATDDIRNKYKWAKVEDGWNPSLDTSVLKTQSSKWFYSKEFNNYVKPTNYIGGFYLDFENRTIYFDIEK